ncbi:MAG TPA: hypothetical protein VMZ66_10585 [Aeromicrobium sp.]|nr:hypothetical protein [Aeromicrobium sp.]
MHLLRVAFLTLLTVAFSASSAQAGFDCSASGGRITALGKTVEPVAVGSPGDCTAATKSLSGAAAGLPLSTIVATTAVYPAQKAVLSGGGITDLVIGTPTLPIDLTKVPADLLGAIRGAISTVDLSAVKSQIPVLPTNLVTNLPTNLPTDLILNPLDPALDTLPEVLAAEAFNAAENARNRLLNAENTATNTANATANALRSSIPDSVAIDTTVITALLEAARLPSLDILRVRSAMASAVGSCQTGRAAVDSWADVAGISVLGQDVSLDQVLNLVRTLTNNIDPAQIVLSTTALGLSPEQSDLITKTAPGALTTLLDSVNSTLQTALAGMGEVKIPLGVADIRIAKGAQVRSGDSVTQQALTVLIAVAGQKVFEAVVGEATASATGVDCAAPVTDPQTSSGAMFGCSTRSLVLVDVLERAGRVKLFGFADPAQAGKKVAIVFNATGRTVAHARVGKDGRFDTTAPLPPAGLRDSNAARYMATFGRDESINLKLRRRMVLDSMTSRNGRVTIAGRVLPPFGEPVRTITLTRRVSCTEEKVVTRFKPDSDGRFRVTVRAPKGVGAAVYRMTTKVRFSAAGSALFETYTLPRSVELRR